MIACAGGIFLIETVVVGGVVIECHIVVFLGVTLGKVEGPDAVVGIDKAHILGGSVELAFLD